MKSKAEIISSVREIFQTQWTTRDGQKIPDVQDVARGNVGVELDAAVLYADLTDSTGLVEGYKAQFAAEIYKSYLLGACEVIKNNGGDITAFDGDRVMAIFIGNNKNSQATKAALQISAIVKSINSELKTFYTNTTFAIRHTVGVDAGQLLAARTGIWKYNDLVWVGSAANYAAKLCVGGDAYYPIRITERVYSKINEASKFGGSPKSNMWKKIVSPLSGVEVYGSNWTWDF
jgi:class 3 adenylate cyclase